jgi:hypothetical protein
MKPTIDATESTPPARWTPPRPPISASGRNQASTNDGGARDEERARGGGPCTRTSADASARSTGGGETVSSARVSAASIVGIGCGVVAMNANAFRVLAWLAALDDRSCSGAVNRRRGARAPPARAGARDVRALRRPACAAERPGSTFPERRESATRQPCGARSRCSDRRVLSSKHPVTSSSMPAVTASRTCCDQRTR